MMYGTCSYHVNMYTLCRHLVNIDPQVCLCSFTPSLFQAFNLNATLLFTDKKQLYLDPSYRSIFKVDDK